LTGDNTFTGGTTINGGRLQADTPTSLGTGDVTINAQGILGGSPTIQGAVTNHGRVAPGNSPGIITVNGDYTQSSNGTLEIEVASFTGPGWVPGTDHDQLQVTGRATLAGRLEIPVIDPLKAAGGPALGLPPIDFLTAGDLDGEFDTIVAPGLDQINENLTVEVEYITDGPNQGARLSFVPTKLNLEFEDVDNDGTPAWQETLSWRDITDPDDPQPATETPDIHHDLEIVNNDNTTQTLVVQNSIERVARLHVGGGTSELILAVGDGNTMDGAETLNSLTSATIKDNGVIALDNGILAASAIEVQNGGLFRGNGLVDLSNEDSTVIGKLTVSSGTLSPGSSVGQITVEGDYEQGSAGTLVVELESQASHDEVDVTGSAQLHGTLEVDLSNLAAANPGDTFDIVSAGNLSGSFNRVNTTGDPRFWVRTFYQHGLNGIASGELCDVGDADCDQQTGGDDGDINAFAFALRDEVAFLNDPRYGSSRQSVDLDGWGTPNFAPDGDVDFDDIDDFVRLHSGSGSSAVIFSKVWEAIKNYQSVPEPNMVWLLVGISQFSVCNRHRRRSG
jgi:hypothetical protein